MESSDHPPSENGFLTSGNNGSHSTRDSPPSWLDLRVFYVRVNKCNLDSSTPQYLKLNHIPLGPNTLLEVNGVRANGNSDRGAIRTLLRRDRMDKNVDEATFVSTDSVRVTGSMKFEVLNGHELLLSGILKRNTNGYSEDSGGDLRRKWSLNCEAAAAIGHGFPQGKRLNENSHVVSPMIEVYVAGSFMGNPTVLSKTLQFGSKSKEVKKGSLSSVSGNSTSAAGERDDNQSSLSLREGGDEEYDYHMEHLHRRTELVEGFDDAEFTWFNAGVRVGVGIGLSVCLGIGIGVGLAVKTYQGATRSFRRNLR